MKAARDNWEREDINSDELPQLRRVSDIMTAFWPRNNPTPSNLKYYLVSQVTNDETNELIGSIMRQANFDKLPSWPGLTVSIEQDAGKALLGSPLGSTVAFILAQHKAELGTKYVSKMTIFRDNYQDDTMALTMLLSKIEDVPTQDPAGAIGHVDSAVKIRDQAQHVGAENISAFTRYLGSVDN